MELMNAGLEQRFKEVGSQENNPDPLVIAKYFNPTGSGTWYAVSYDPETREFFGYVSIFGDYCDEFGNFSLDELESLELPMGLKIERDMYCGEMKLSEHKPPNFTVGDLELQNAEKEQERLNNL